MKENPVQAQSIGFFDILFSLGNIKLKFLKLLDFAFGHFFAFCLHPQKKKNIAGDQVKSMLVIRPGGLGDAIFLLPILRAIKKQYPNVDIDVLGELRNIHAFLSQKEVCRDVFCYDKQDELKSVFKRAYDVVVDTEQWHYLSALVSYKVKAQCRVGFATTSLRGKLFNVSIPYLVDCYELTNFQNLFRSIFKFDAFEHINHSFSIAQSHLDWASKEIPTNSVTLFLGASIPLRRFTHEQCVQIIHYLVERRSPVVLLGGNDILDDTSMLMKKVGDQSLIYNYVGKTSLDESAALIKRSRLFIGTDSGLMHLAAAVGTPVIAVFGPGNLEKWKPQGDHHTIVSEYASCSPCTRFGYTVPTCHGSYHCMRGLKMEKIFRIFGWAIDYKN